jgi:hypothetical protein
MNSPDIESRYVGGFGTVISYLGEDRVRLRDLHLDVEMTAAMTANQFEEG